MATVRFHIVRHARIENVGKSQSCMVSKLRMIWVLGLGWSGHPLEGPSAARWAAAAPDRAPESTWHRSIGAGGRRLIVRDRHVRCGGNGRWAHPGLVLYDDRPTDLGANAQICHQHAAVAALGAQLLAA